ncbi:MAG TPA: ABC transporter permease, partial [Polyangiaceae bacterium]|nr:ABC transporter permease [Polyangiaceae bacterium]
MLSDFRFALRLFARSPLFAAAVVLVLGLGVGASTTVFTLVDAYLLKPLPYPEPERLAAIWRTQHHARRTNPFSVPDLLDVAEQAKSFSHVAALTEVELNLAGGAEAGPESVPASVVSAGFFPVLGVNAALGRAFTADEDVPGRDQVVVLSDALWRRRFGADPSVVGRTLTLDGEPFQVLGVMPPSFRAPSSLHATRPAELWMPAALTRENAGSRNAHGWHLLARLRPGASIEGADAEVGLIARRLEQTYPDTNTNKTFYAVSLQEHLVAAVRPSLTILFVATLLLLVIASANVALLLMARAAARE